MTGLGLARRNKVLGCSCVYKLSPFGRCPFQEWLHFWESILGPLIFGKFQNSCCRSYTRNIKETMLGMYGHHSRSTGIQRDKGSG